MKTLAHTTAKRTQYIIAGLFCAGRDAFSRPPAVIARAMRRRARRWSPPGTRAALRCYEPRSADHEVPLQPYLGAAPLRSVSDDSGVLGHRATVPADLSCKADRAWS